LIGCGFPFEIAFTGANDRPGLYEVDVVTDGVAATCTIEHPRECDCLSSRGGAPFVDNSPCVPVVVGSTSWLFRS
jgi:hypothetical protein